MQCEYACGTVFGVPRIWALYESITRPSMRSRRSRSPNSCRTRSLAVQRRGRRAFTTRIEGTCIKHHMGRVAGIKMYDKLGRVLRVETTVNDVSFFKHHRKVDTGKARPRASAPLSRKASTA